MGSEFVRILKSDKKRLRELFPNEEIKDPIRLNKALDVVETQRKEKKNKGFWN
jgi:hypothetical protein